MTWLKESMAYKNENISWNIRKTDSSRESFPNLRGCTFYLWEKDIKIQWQNHMIYHQEMQIDKLTMSNSMSCFNFISIKFK